MIAQRFLSTTTLLLATLALGAPAAAKPISAANQPASAFPTVAPGKLVKRSYQLRIGKKTKTVKAKKIVVQRPGDGGGKTKLVIDGKVSWVSALVSVRLSQGTGEASTQQSKSTTVSDLPGGGTRVDIDNGDGSSTTIVHDPHGGKNGGSRTTTSTTDGNGNTTTTTTTTDGSDGSSTTTTTTSNDKD